MTGVDGNHWPCRACNARPPRGHPFHGSGVACHFPTGHEGGHAWEIGSGRFYGYEGEPISHEQWLRLLANEDGRQVARDELPDGVEVSTVWLGIDYGRGHTLRPLVYETVIFGGPLEGRGARYATREEALAGHAQAVEQARREEGG
jgi:hypothetical protein